MVGQRPTKRAWAAVSVVTLLLGGVSAVTSAQAASASPVATRSAAAPASAQPNRVRGGGPSTPSYSSDVLASKPSAYYRLGDAKGSAAADSSGHKVNGTYESSGVKSVSGAIAGDSNAAASVSTAQPLLSAPADSLPSGKASRTVETWFRTSVGRDYYDLETLLTYGSDTNTLTVQTVGNSGLAVANVATNSDTYNEDGTVESFSYPYGLDDSQWHLIDVTYDGTTLTAYLDGQDIGQQNVALNTIAAGSTLTIGGAQAHYDEAAIYPSALSAASVNAHWTRGETSGKGCVSSPHGAYPSAVTADKPALYLRYGDTARLAADSSGHCVNGVRPDSTLVAPGAILGDSNSATTEGAGGGPVVAAGADSLPAGRGSRTVEMWFRTGVSREYYDLETLLSYGSGTNTFTLQTIGNIGLEVATVSTNSDTFNETGDVYSFNYPGGIDDSEWHLLDVTYDGSVLTDYLDGQEIGTLSGVLNTAAAGSSLTVGGAQGDYDETAVYATALSAARVEAHWRASGHEPPTESVPTPRELTPGGNLAERCWLAVLHSCSGDPVDDESGAFGETVSDISIPGRGLALDWSRSYATTSNAVDGPLGYGWSGSYTANLTTDADTGDVSVVQEDGSQVVFTPLEGGGYTAPPRVQATLSLNANGTYTLLRKGSDSLVFSAAGQLTSLTDRNGLTTSLSYAAGVLSTVTDVEGRSLTFTWTGGHITKVADGAGRSVSYTYTAAGVLATVTDVTGGVTKYGYDTKKLLTTILDPAQATASTPHPVTNAYDASGRVTSQTDQLKRTTTFAYAGDPNSGAGGTTTVTDPSGHVKVDTFSYGERLSTVTGSGTAGAVTSWFAYDPDTLGVTQVSTTTAGDPNTHDQQFAYNAQGLPVTTVDGEGRTTTLTYNSFGEVLTSTAPNPSATGPSTITKTNTYDAHGNSLTTSTPLSTSATAFTNRVTTYTPDSARPDLVHSVTDPQGKTSVYAYDAYGDVASVKSPEGRSTKYTYDVLSRVRSTVAPQGNVSGATKSRFTTTYSYDKAGRPTTVSVANGSTPLVTATTYDKDGRTATVTDPKGQKTTSAYDVASELITQTRPDGTTLRTTYFPDGVVKSQIDGAGNATTYTEDALGRTASTTDQSGNVTAYTYDAAGNALTTTDPMGQVTTSTYDNSGLETDRTYSNAASPEVSYTYSPAGTRATMIDGTGTSSWTYDSLGRVKSNIAAVGKVSYSYDLDGHLTKLTYPGGKTVTRTFGSDGELTSLTDFSSAKSTFTYTTDGVLATASTPNGVTQTTSYDDPDRISGIAIAHGATNLATLSYTRDADSNLSSEGSTGLGSPANSYTYNARNEVTGGGGTASTYDPADNLTTTPSGSVQTFAANNELTKSTTAGGVTTGYAYNADGSRTGATGATYGYNQDQQLTSYTVGSALKVSYGYDGDGLRTSKTVGSTTSAYAYDTAGAVPLLIADGANSYIYGPTDVPIEQVNTGTGVVTYLHADGLGSIRLATAADGTIAGTANYDAYGTRTATGTTTPFAYAGQYQDTETGLLWMRARYYDPSTGQFLTRDPLVATTRQPYAYADNNPVNVVDPSGLETQWFRDATSPWTNAWDNSATLSPWANGVQNIEADPKLGVAVAVVSIAAPVAIAACAAGACEAAVLGAIADPSAFAYLNAPRLYEEGAVIMDNLPFDTGAASASYMDVIREIVGGKTFNCNDIVGGAQHVAGQVYSSVADSWATALAGAF